MTSGMVNTAAAATIASPAESPASPTSPGAPSAASASGPAEGGDRHPGERPAADGPLGALLARAPGMHPVRTSAGRAEVDHRAGACTAAGTGTLLEHRSDRGSAPAAATGATGGAIAAA